MSGYARIHRTLLGHPAFRNDAEAMAFAWMVVRASWQPCAARYKGRCIQLGRGQLATSVRDFADAMDRDKGWVERLLKRLKASGMIETATGTGFLVVTICNYAEYQSDGERRKTASKTLKKTDARQPQDTEQEGEEREEEKTPLPPEGGRRGKTFLPSDWVLPAVSDLPPKAQACAAQWTEGNYSTHGEAFVSYWASERKMKADWRGTWANRVIALHSQVMRDQKFGNSAPDTRTTSPTEWTAERQQAYLAGLHAESAAPVVPVALRVVTNLGKQLSVGARR